MANEILSKYLTIKLWSSSNNVWEAVARSTGYSFEVNKETVDVTSFDSNGWKEFKVDLKEATLSGDSLVMRTDEAGKINYQELLESIVGSDTLFAIQIINPNAASLTSAQTDTPAEAKAYAHELVTGYLTGLSHSGSLGDKQTFSWTIQPTGEVILVKAVYALKADADTDIASFTDGDVILVLDQIADTDTGYMVKNTTWQDYTVTGVTE
jgi:predicted secreted protein